MKKRCCSMMSYFSVFIKNANPKKNCLSFFCCKLLLCSLVFQLLFGAAAYTQQGIKVSGSVKGPNGESLPSVTVHVKGTQTNTLTDEQGNFSISVPDSRAILVFSHVSFVQQEHDLKGQATTIQVVLAPDATGLNTVVVVGYGTQKKRDVTGSVGSVSGEQMKQVVATSAVQAIQGRVAGVRITQDNWNPGAGATVRVRGSRSIEASNDPLYIVDGNPLSRGNVTITDINPSDIESMEILKDAAATAIYGSRGANGVILITTKRGKAGKTTIDYDAYEGIQTPLRTVDVWNGGEYAEYVRESYRNNNIYGSPTADMEEDKDLAQFSQDPFVIESVLMGYDANGNYDPAKVRSFDWMDAVMQTGNVRSHQVSLRGGSEKTKAMISAGYFANKGVIKNMDYNRINFRINLDHNVNSWLKLSTSSLVSRANENIGSNLYSLARQVNPLASPTDANGTLVVHPGNDPLIANPILDIDGIIDESKKDHVLINLNAEANIFKGLRYRVNLGYDYRTARDGRFEKSTSTPRSGSTDWARYEGNTATDLIMENLLFYDKTINDDHKLGITLLHSLQTNRFETFGTTVEGLPYSSQWYYNLGSATTILSTNTRLEEWQMFSLMGRINYNFKNKYYVTLAGRHDGSSVLAEGNKYQFFPSVALAWRAIEENFLRGANFLNELKLRVSYGKTGNSAVNPYQTQGNLSLIRYVWDEMVAVGYAPGLMPNPDLSWETTSQVDIGLDFGFFKNRISGTFEVYRANTSDLIMNRKLPVVSGFVEVLSNVGKTRNTGFEASLSTINIASKKGFNWTTSLVYSYNKEELIEHVGGKVDDIGNNLFIGEQVGSFYDQKVIGIWQNTAKDLEEIEKFNTIGGHNFEPGLVRLEDKNGDYKITDADDRYLLGGDKPKWTAGITNDISFKNFDLSFQLYASQGIMGIFDKALQLNGRQNMVDIDYWTEANPSNKYPKPNAGWLSPDFIFESYYQDASYVRLKFVTLGYTLHEGVKKKMGMNAFRIYASVQNPKLWTKFDGLDPEGAQGFSSPSITTYMVGVKVGL